MLLIYFKYYIIYIIYLCEGRLKLVDQSPVLLVLFNADRTIEMFHV